MSPVDSTPTFVPDLKFVQNTFTQDSTLQCEIRKLRAEIERKDKETSERDEKIRRSTRELRDQDTKNVHLVKQFRGYLEKLRTEKSALEQANHSLARENLEAKGNQGKAKKDKELIRKLNCELGRSGRIRKKQSALVKANESLAKDHSELRGGSDKHWTISVRLAQN